MSREHHPGDSSIVLLNPSLETFFFFREFSLMNTLIMKGEGRLLIII